MNPEVKELWLGALESGEWLQTSGALKKGALEAVGTPRYCCLGVLAELAVQSGQVPNVSWKVDGWTHSLIETGDNPETNCGMPTSAVYAWAGLSEEDAQFLADFNDDQDASFTQIAAVIRRFL